MKWRSVKKLPEYDGRYFIMVMFDEPVISNDSIVRKQVPMVSNYRTKQGWMGEFPGMTVTHWMEVPTEYEED